MAGTPIEIAQRRLDAYLVAEMRILSAGQEGSVATRRRRDAELAEIRRAISDLQAEIERLSSLVAGGSRLITVIPR